MEWVVRPNRKARFYTARCGIKITICGQRVIM